MCWIAQPCFSKANSKILTTRNSSKRISNSEKKQTIADPKMLSLAGWALTSIMKSEMWGILIMRIPPTSWKSMKISSGNFWRIGEILAKSCSRKSVWCIPKLRQLRKFIASMSKVLASSSPISSSTSRRFLFSVKICMPKPETYSP